MKGRRMIRKREGGRGGGMQEEVVRHWPVSFWVRGGDKTGEHGNRELMRDKEGERKAVYSTTAERMFSSCVQDWNCAVK